jgi:hypothetical protein
MERCRVGVTTPGLLLRRTSQVRSRTPAHEHERHRVLLRFELQLAQHVLAAVERAESGRPHMTSKLGLAAVLRDGVAFEELALPGRRFRGVRRQVGLPPRSAKPTPSGSKTHQEMLVIENMLASNCGRHGPRTALVLGFVFLLAGCRSRPTAGESTPAVSSSSGSASTPAAPSAAASTAGQPSLAGVADACKSICERSRELKCKNADECLLDCVAAGSQTPCNAEFQVFYGCLREQPSQNWECAEDGVAAIKPPFCDQQQERAVRCMEVKAKP